MEVNCINEAVPKVLFRTTFYSSLAFYVGVKYGLPPPAASARGAKENIQAETY
jgi:hypothetical protein